MRVLDLTVTLLDLALSSRVQTPELSPGGNIKYSITTISSGIFTLCLPEETIYSHDDLEYFSTEKHQLSQRVLNIIVH